MQGAANVGWTTIASPNPYISDFKSPPMQEKLNLSGGQGRPRETRAFSLHRGATPSAALGWVQEFVHTGMLCSGRWGRAGYSSNETEESLHVCLYLCRELGGLCRWGTPALLDVLAARAVVCPSRYESAASLPKPVPLAPFC